MQGHGRGLCKRFFLVLCELKLHKNSVPKLFQLFNERKPKTQNQNIRQGEQIKTIHARNFFTVPTCPIKWWVATAIIFHQIGYCLSLPLGEPLMFQLGFRISSHTSTHSMYLVPGFKGRKISGARQLCMFVPLCPHIDCQLLLGHFWQTLYLPLQLDDLSNDNEAQE